MINYFARGAGVKKEDAYANTLITPSGESETGSEAKGTAPEASSASSSPDERIGQVLGDRYEIERLAGSGGFGVVYSAVDRRLQKRVAVKILTRDTKDVQLVERFRAEALAAGRLDHPNIVGATDFDITDDGVPYMVMDFVDGEPLDQMLARQGPLNVRRATRLARGLCRALAQAHDAGIIHRDLKPANIIIKPEADGSESPKIVDFGLVKLVQSHLAPSLTDTGQTLGTPIYMSPEQVRGRTDIDGRADLYSVGVILYEMLTGRTPFSSKSAGDVMVAKVVDKPEPLSTYARVPAGLERLVLCTIDPDPAKRVGTAAEMSALLESFTADTMATSSVDLGLPKQRSAWPAMAAALAVVAVALAGYAVVRSKRSPASHEAAASPGPSPVRSGGDLADGPVAPIPAASPAALIDAGVARVTAPIAADATPPDAAAKAAPKKRIRKGRRPGRDKAPGGLYDSPRDRLRVPR